MDKTIKIIAAVLAVLAVGSIAVMVLGAPAQKDNGITGADTVYYFYGEECPHCHNIMPFVTSLARKYPDANIQILEVWHNQTNQRIFQKAGAAAGVTQYGVPKVIIGKAVLTGELEIPAKMESLVQDYLKKKP